ncbi:MAG TPA: winged helix-turn-helix domain-containing protein [Candidatus Sulfotelmatobacter sp.]|nr:winged helix-turn-helix domain-containing protein [Candidatus Sulfotelmatobacter sp.]
MKSEDKFQFGDFEVDPLARTLRRSEEVVTLNRRAFDVLFYLVKNPGRVLSRDELLKNVWPDTFVDENSLAQSISTLRRALAEKPGDNSYILTLPGRGYQFVSQVKVVASAPVDQEALIAPDRAAEGVGRPAGLLLQRETIRTSIATTELPRLSARHRWGSVALIVLGAVVAGALYVAKVRPAHQLTEQDTVVLADITNQTGDPVFDDTLKTALGIALAQSPLLNTLSENRIRTTLRLMARPNDTKITSDVAREVCQRTGGKAYIAGSIVSLGSQYVLTLEAARCADGDTMAREQVTASAKEKVLDALGKAASKLRSELGESLATVHEYDVSLPQATTPSLEALKAFSIGQKFLYQRDPASALTYFEHALALDPNFASAHAQLGITYYTLSEPGRARENITKAFQLRGNTSERENLHISAIYYGYGTGEIDKAIQALQQGIEIYKRGGAYNGLADLYSRIGDYEKSAEAARMLLALDPENNFSFVNLALDDLAQQDFSGARQIITQAQGRLSGSYLLHCYSYTLAFLQNNPTGMADQQWWFASQPVYANYGLSLAANTEAYAGHVKKARDLTRSAAESAIRSDNKENAAMYRASSAVQDAAYGNSAEARASAEEALKLVPENPNVAIQAALAFAMTHDGAKAERLVEHLNNNFPLDTQIQSLGLPAIQGQLQLTQMKADLALETLRAGLPIEYANTAFTSNNISCLYPTYIRGEAYLAARQGAAAAGEFQKILDHSGIVGNCWTGALAHLGLGRAAALQAATYQGDQASTVRAQAIGAYKAFLDLWKDADPAIPVLKEAKAEFAKLK